MANQFWGQAPIADYTPKTQAEILGVPRELYARDQALEAQMDALNEANLSLQSALGPAAGKQTEFTNAYQNILKRITTEGATKRNLDEAKNVKA